MQRINLEALESKNMTVASDEMLSEVNGGCTFKYESYANGTYTFCGQTYTRYSYKWNRYNKCNYNCPVGAVEFVKKWDAPNATVMKVRKDLDCKSGKAWKVDVGNYTYSVSSNLPNGSWFHY